MDDNKDMIEEAIHKLVKGLSEDELDLDHITYSQMYKYLKQSPKLALREHLEKCSNAARLLLDISIATYVSAEFNAQVEQFRDKYIDYLDLQKDLVHDIERINTKILLILERNNALQQIFKPVKECIGAQSG
jgi:hypothetical protein